MSFLKHLCEELCCQNTSQLETVSMMNYLVSHNGRNSHILSKIYESGPISYIAKYFRHFENSNEKRPLKYLTKALNSDLSDVSAFR